MNYTLTKKETGNKAARFHYQITDESGTIISERKSNRDYVAATINAHYFFGRLDLIGKGDHGRQVEFIKRQGGTPPAIAYLATAPAPSPDERIRQRFNEHQFNLWSNPNRPADTQVDECEHCGKKLGANPLFVHITTGGIIVPNDISETDLALIGEQSQGCFPIGQTCAKKLLGKFVNEYATKSSDNKSPLKSGDVVDVYHDPQTKKELEGAARIEFIHAETETEIRADVRFIGEESDGFFYRTIINPGAIIGAPGSGETSFSANDDIPSTQRTTAGKRVAREFHKHSSQMTGADMLAMFEILSSSLSFKLKLGKLNFKQIDAIKMMSDEQTKRFTY